MELQWPLIIFTTFIAWSAGAFGAQGILAIKGERFKAQLPLLVTSFVIMAVGGIAVFFHLEHWERIFNGFGHITSGITQELIGIILMVIVMVVYFAQLRRRNDNSVPAWCGVLALVVAVILVIAMGHSYVMAARPAWESIIQICSLLGAACLLGPATAAVVMAFCGDDPKPCALTLLIGSIVNAAATILYLFEMGGMANNLTSVGYYYDPTQIARGMIDVDAATGLLAGSRMGLVIAIVVCVLAAIVCALALKVKAPAADLRLWKGLGIVTVVLGVAAAMILRIVFYELGIAIYMFF